MVLPPAYTIELTETSTFTGGLVDVRAPKRKPTAKGTAPGSAIPVETLAEYIGRNPGSTSQQITRALGIDPALVKRGLAKMRKAEAVTTEGKNRGQKYTLANGAAAEQESAA